MMAMWQFQYTTVFLSYLLALYVITGGVLVARASEGGMNWLWPSFQGRLNPSFLAPAPPDPSLSKPHPSKNPVPVLTQQAGCRWFSPA